MSVLMKLTCLFLSWCLGMGVVLAQDADALRNDWLLIPERRAGPITREWTGADLMKAFGTLHCQKQDIPVGEGETVSGYLLFAGTEDELQVMMNAETGKVESVQVVAGFEMIKDPKTGEIVGSKAKEVRSRWHSVSGITLGSTLEKVTEVNGGPFEIVGWETDISGYVSSWKGGKIPETFWVRFDYGDTEAYNRIWQQVSENNPWDGASDGRIMPQLKLTVYMVGIRL